MEGHNYSHDVLLMPSKAAKLGRAEDTLTRIHALWRDTSAKRSTWNHQCLEQGGALNSPHVETTQADSHGHTAVETTQTDSHGCTAVETNIFLNRERQTRDDN